MNDTVQPAIDPNLKELRDRIWNLRSNAAKAWFLIESDDKAMTKMETMDRVVNCLTEAINSAEQAEGLARAGSSEPFGHSGPGGSDATGSQG